MSDETQDTPVMDGSDDATNRQKLAGLAEQVQHDHGDEGGDAKAAHLRDRMAETGTEDEEPGALAGTTPPA
jgi:hypothetical protein